VQKGLQENEDRAEFSHNGGLSMNDRHPLPLANELRAIAHDKVKSFRIFAAALETPRGKGIITNNAKNRPVKHAATLPVSRRVDDETAN
jgi:hypothetical protein